MQKRGYFRWLPSPVEILVSAPPTRGPYSAGRESYHHSCTHRQEIRMPPIHWQLHASKEVLTLGLPQLHFGVHWASVSVHAISCSHHKQGPVMTFGFHILFQYKEKIVYHQLISHSDPAPMPHVVELTDLLRIFLIWH